MNANSLPEILTVEEAASYLRLTVEELDMALETHQIPAVKLVGQWRIKREVLERLFESPSTTTGVPAISTAPLPETDAEKSEPVQSNPVSIQPATQMTDQNEEPLGTLRDLLGQYLGMRDLYSSTLPVSGRRFFGREQLLLQLTDEVKRGQFLGIYGLRKMGKTSLIYQLRDEKLSGGAVAYADLQTLTTKNCAELYWKLEHDLYQRLFEHNSEAAGLLRLGKSQRFSDLPDHGMSASLFFAEDLQVFLDALGMGKIPNVHRLVIVLDELEQMLPIGTSPGIQGYLEFFGLLRGLAQTERSRGLLSCVVVAANAAISEKGYWEGRENPVFALYKKVFLPPLAPDECAQMICDLGKGMSVHWDEAAIHSVFIETGGHPFLTRAFCSRIAQQNPTRPLKVTIDIVREQVVPFIRDEGDKLEQITEMLRTHFPQEETLLEQIALEEAPVEIQDEALQHLLSYQLLTVDRSRYHITLNLLRRWLRRRAGIKE